MNITRRTFFKVNAVGAATLAGVGTADAAAPEGPHPDAKAVLVDTTLCIGCRGCEAACAEANHLAEPDSDEDVFAARRATAPDRFTVVNRFTPGGDEGTERFIKTQCMHCIDPACATACPARALEKTAAGPVTYNGDRCLGCRYCMVSCPFDVPKFEYDKTAPYVRKCTFCAERQAKGQVPACVEACPGGALTFGRRADLIEEARRRIYQSPGSYAHHIYGEHEAGGTSWLYISDVPPERLGLKPGVGTTARPKLISTALGAVPMIVTLWPPVLMGLYALRHRAGQAPTEDADE